MTTRTLHVYTIETQMVCATRADSKQWSWPGIRSHAAIGLGSAIVAAIMVGSAVVMHLGPWAEEPLPVFWPTPTFSLIDQQGRPFGSGDLTGRAVLFSFVYTNCPDVCPLLSANMAQVQNKLRSQGMLGTKVQLVSITVDPRRDTQSVLAEHAGRCHADPDAWRFLSGGPDAIYRALWGFKLNTVEVARAVRRGGRRSAREPLRGDGSSRPGPSSAAG